MTSLLQLRYLTLTPFKADRKSPLPMTGTWFKHEPLSNRDEIPHASVDLITQMTVARWAKMRVMLGWSCKAQMTHYFIAICCCSCFFFFSETAGNHRRLGIYAVTKLDPSVVFQQTKPLFYLLTRMSIRQNNPVFSNASVSNYKVTLPNRRNSVYWLYKTRKNKLPLALHIWMPGQSSFLISHIRFWMVILLWIRCTIYYIFFSGPAKNWICLNSKYTIYFDGFFLVVAVDFEWRLISEKKKKSI